jgi:hypothetical protein
MHPKPIAILSLVMVCLAGGAAAQTEPQPAQHVHEHDMAVPGWSWMYEGALFAGLNSQGGNRGETQFRSQNWLMTMGTRPLGRGQLTLTAMFSAEPLTVRPEGYSQLFQIGEAYKGLENIDRQHPHDLFSQLGASWRVPFGDTSGLTIAAAPVGEATLGPIAFMHRASASENPTAPLGHHTFDSTHIANSVVALSVDAGPLTLDASTFRGREPDEHRYDLDVGKPDSYAARLWYRPSPSWIAQVSYGFLESPEQLEPGDVRRTTASVSWLRENADGNFLALTGLVGHNTRTYDGLTAFLVEHTQRVGMNTVYGRAEVLQIETEHFLFPTVVHRPHPGELIDRVGAFTGGYVRDFARKASFELGVGGDATFYTVPVRLHPTHGEHPVSFHVFLRLRPRTAGMGRMWNMTMVQPMRTGSHAAMP